MPTGGKGMLFGWANGNDVQLPFAVFERLLNRFHQAREIGLLDYCAVLDGVNDGRNAIDLGLGVGTDSFLIEPDSEKALLV